MIPEKTVLVLGAGASRPYLFPTGAELTNLILMRGENTSILSNMGFPSGRFSDEDQGNLFIPDGDAAVVARYRQWIKRSLRNEGVDQDDLERFQAEFRLGQSYSIDAFVADVPIWKPVASLMVAAILLRCEKLERLDGNWYQYLFNELVSGGKDFPENTLSVVTFNYDRSLEMYLQQAFEHRYSLSQVEAWKLVQRIKIVHVYGQPGELFDAKGSRSFGYGAVSAFTAGAQNIQLVSPRLNSPRQAEIEDVLSQASRIVVLGFGFDELNVKVLKFGPTMKPVFATQHGLPYAAKARAERHFTTKYSSLSIATNSPVKWGQENQFVLEFLKFSGALV